MQCFFPHCVSSDRFSVWCSEAWVTDCFRLCLSAFIANQTEGHMKARDGALLIDGLVMFIMLSVSGSLQWHRDDSSHFLTVALHKRTWHRSEKPALSAQPFPHVTCCRLPQETSLNAIKPIMIQTANCSRSEFSEVNKSVSSHFRRTEILTSSEWLCI